ncbi:hypothetical protein ACP70R_019614 [Stipagrostis hirtigluma subsp. patula]
MEEGSAGRAPLFTCRPEPRALSTCKQQQQPAMAAALLRRALHLHRVLHSPFPAATSSSAPAHRVLSAFTTTVSQQSAGTPVDLSSDESRRCLVNRYARPFRSVPRFPAAPTVLPARRRWRGVA